MFVVVKYFHLSWNLLKVMQIFSGEGKKREIKKKKIMSDCIKSTSRTKTLLTDSFSITMDLHEIWLARSRLKLTVGWICVCFLTYRVCYTNFMSTDYLKKKNLINKALKMYISPSVFNVLIWNFTHVFFSVRNCLFVRTADIRPL